MTPCTDHHALRVRLEANARTHLATSDATKATVSTTCPVCRCVITVIVYA